MAIQPVLKMKPKTKPNQIKPLWKVPGPYLVTSASDDDPSGIATYSQAGGAHGLSTLWTALITFPLMAAIHEVAEIFKASLEIVQFV